MKEREKKNISFAGCGFIGIYHLGVCACLQRYSAHLLRNKIGGSSAGAMVALALASGDISLKEMTRKVLMVAHQASNNILGPFNPNFNLHQILKNYFVDNLQENVAEKVSGRLFVSITKARNKENLLVSEFSSKEDLVDAVCASSFIPVMSDWRPHRYRGQIALDGGYSDNIPALGDITITVSPFAGDASICPKEEFLPSISKRFPHGTGGCVDISMENISKLGQAIIPPKASGMHALCCQGFKDATRYLMTENLIRCEECSGRELSENCQNCALVRQDVITSSLPHELTQVFEDIRELELQESSNSLRGYLRSFSSKIICTLTLPLTPAKFKGFRPTIEVCPFANL